MADVQQEEQHGVEAETAVKGSPSLDNHLLTSPSRALVIDNGSLTIKSGFGGDSAPASELLSVVGRIKFTSSCMFGGRGMEDSPVGAEALQKTSIFRCKWPIQGDRVDNWDDVELLWHNVFYEELKVDPKEHALLMTAPVGLTPKDRETMCILIFESFCSPAFFASDSAPLALYATGRTTGLVVDSGHCRTAAVPIYEGFPLVNAMQTFGIAGREITVHLRSLLGGRYYPFITNTTDQLVMGDVKERCCYLAEDPCLALVNKAWEEAPYTLPDGQIIQVGRERFQAPAPMFSPMIGLPAAVLRSIAKSDVHLREELSRNIVLSGGNTLFTGFADRLRQGLDDAFESTWSPSKMKFGVVTPPDAKRLAWLGGSVLSSLSTFRDVYIKASEYDEYGPVMMRRKCWGIGSH